MSARKKKFRVGRGVKACLGWILIPFCLFIQQCGGGESTPPLGGGLELGEVLFLSFDDLNQSSFQFAELSGGEEFSIVYYSASTFPGRFAANLAAAPVSSPNLLRTQESNLLPAPTDYLGNDPFLAEKTVSASCANGAGIQIKVLTDLYDTSQVESTCGILVHTSNYAEYYVDQTVANQVTFNFLQTIIQNFEAIIPSEESLLGEAPTVGENPLFTVYFTPAVNRLGSGIRLQKLVDCIPAMDPLVNNSQSIIPDAVDSSGFVTGYFYGGNLFSANSIFGSNERAIIFLGVPDPQGQFNLVLSEDFWAQNIASTTLPHELAHLLTFNQRVLVNKLQAIPAFFNEGISELMEDLNPQTLLTRVSVENPSRVQTLLKSPHIQCPFEDTSMPLRGQSYLFMRYLFEQAEQGLFPGLSSGADLFSSLYAEPTNGFENIQNITQMKMSEIWGNYFAALVLSDRGLNTDARFQFQGICLRCTFDDNRNTQLEGLSFSAIDTLPLTVEIPAGSAYFFSITGEGLNQMGTQLQFQGAPAMVPGVDLIRIQ